MFFIRFLVKASYLSFFIVMNFQSIRNDFNQQVKEQTEALEAEQMRVHLAEELERQDRLHARTR